MDLVLTVICHVFGNYALRPIELRKYYYYLLYMIIHQACLPHFFKNYILYTNLLITKKFLTQTLNLVHRHFQKNYQLKNLQ